MDHQKLLYPRPQIVSEKWCSAPHLLKKVTFGIYLLHSLLHNQKCILDFKLPVAGIIRQSEKSTFLQVLSTHPEAKYKSITLKIEIFLT